MIDKREILQLFDRQVRANPTPKPGLDVIRDGTMVRYEGAFNYICCWDFTEQQSQAEVTKIAQYFVQKGQSLMWRVYAHDGPKNLEYCLNDAGFEAQASGTLMVLPVADTRFDSTAHDIRVVSNIDMVDDYLHVAKTAFGSVEPGQRAFFQSTLNDKDFLLYCGYCCNAPVATGMLQLIPDSRFGQLFGGAVVPDCRGKGFYRACIAQRVEYARQHGIEYLLTEAWDTSRPILQSMGFIPLVGETTWILSSE